MFLIVSKVYESIVDHLFPIVASFFFGSWSDTFGRKWLLYLYFIIRWIPLHFSTIELWVDCRKRTSSTIFLSPRLLEGSSMLLNAHFMSWPKEFLLFSVNLPVALSGGYITYRLATQIFHSIMCTLWKLTTFQPQYGYCCLHHWDLNPWAKNVPPCHDPLCIKLRKSYRHQGTGYFQYRKEKQLSVLKVYTKGSTLCSDWSSSLGCGWEGPALHVHLRGRPWWQACHADLFGRQAGDV